jgi:hypothetical protein
MSRVELKQRKKMVLPFLLVCVVVIAGTGLAVFLSEKYMPNTATKIGFFCGFAFFAYFMYSPIRKLIKNQPIIVFETESITLNTNKAITIQKKEINDIWVTYIDDTGYFLKIKTKDTTHETNISWLDKTPDEIKKLIKVYRE